MTEQEAFTKAVVGLRAQGFEKAMAAYNNYSCAYAAKDGKKCAVGQLLTKEEAFFMEGKSIDAILRVWPERIPSLAGLDPMFLGRLQSAHDSANEPKDMELNLRMLAERRGLTYPEPE